MTYYVFSYDAGTGAGLGASISNSTYDIDLAESSQAGAYLLAELPYGFISTDFKVDFSNLDSNDLPIYIIDRYTGYAYDHNGDRASIADQEPETIPESIAQGSYIENRGIGMGDTVSTGSSSSETPSESSDLTEEQREVYESEVSERMSGISAGRSVLVNIGISAGDGEDGGWALDVTSNKYVRTIANEAITPSTVLCVTGINREALITHIYWVTEEGQITFTTDKCPTRDILINGWLFETGDEWSAKGVIEAWPAAGITSRRLQQSRQTNFSNWSVAIPAHGSVTILTSADFGAAHLLFATPEYTGNSHVVIPHIYIDSVTHRLAYVLTNTYTSSVNVSEVMLRLCYMGVVSGIIDSLDDDAKFEPYITEVDIDAMVDANTGS